MSNEADVFPREHVERTALIDSTIGEGSPFDRSFGYYAHASTRPLRSCREDGATG